MAAQHPCTAPLEWSLGFSSLSFCPSGSPCSHKVLSTLLRTPGLGTSVYGLTHPFYPGGLPFPLSSIPGAQVPTWCFFPPVLPDYLEVESFLQAWLFRNSSASFQLIFHENFSTCRCIFDVFVGLWGAVSSMSSYFSILIPFPLQFCFLIFAMDTMQALKDFNRLYIYN